MLCCCNTLFLQMFLPQSHCSCSAAAIATDMRAACIPPALLPHTLPACLPARHCLAPGEQVGVNLGQPGYMEAIAKQTADIDIQVVFCNAGYVLTGFFADV